MEYVCSIKTKVNHSALFSCLFLSCWWKIRPLLPTEITVTSAMIEWPNGGSWGSWKCVFCIEPVSFSLQIPWETWIVVSQHQILTNRPRSLVQVIRSYWKILKVCFFSTPMTPQFIHTHTHIIKIHCLYLPGFLSPKLPQKSMGGPVQTTVRPKPEGWFGAKRRRLGPAGKTGGVWTKGTPRATNEAGGWEVAAVGCSMGPMTDPWDEQDFFNPTNENHKNPCNGIHVGK